MVYRPGRSILRRLQGGFGLTLGVRIEHLWMAVPALVVTWMGLMHPLWLLDFWWHLKVGEIIVNSGEMPRVALFSLTCAGQPFIYHDWLSEVLYSDVPSRRVPAGDRRHDRTSRLGFLPRPFAVQDWRMGATSADTELTL